MPLLVLQLLPLTVEPPLQLNEIILSYTDAVFFLKSLSAWGYFGNPGILRVSPIKGTQKSALVEITISRTVMQRSSDLPFSFGLLDKEAGILAI